MCGRAGYKIMGGQLTRVSKALACIASGKKLGQGNYTSAYVDVLLRKKITEIGENYGEERC